MQCQNLVCNVQKVVKNMDTSLNIQIPDWLTEDEINRLRKCVSSCDNPYTEQEMQDIPLDGFWDISRLEAYEAKRVLQKYGLL